MNIPSIFQSLLGLLLAVIAALASLRAGALSRSGAWAAAISGGLIFGLGGWPWAILLLLFFVSSSALSHLFSNRKNAVIEKYSKGSQRDWGQVFANGGLGALLVVLNAWQPGSTWLWVAYVGSIAAVNADTWATELGVLSKTLPRMITNGKPVDRGTSGGVSWIGSLAATGEAGIIAAAAVFLAGTNWTLFLPAVVGGLAGSFFDSLLGGTLQAIYYCPACHKETERHPLHICGTETTPLRGWTWLNNDWVNFACSLVGALSASAMWWLIIR